MNDVFYQYWCYSLLYVGCGGIFAGYVALYKLLRPKYYGLVLFCTAFSVIAFGVLTAASAAHSSFQGLANLTPAQELIRASLLAHVSLVGFVVPTLAAILAGEALNDFVKARRRVIRGS
jgi:ABC-type uncharacterized transport system YnjBCD permease subunit